MSWRNVKLQNVCSLLTDGTHYTPPDLGNGIPFLTVKDVSENGLDFVNCSKISEDEYKKADAGNSAPKFGDVLFSKDGTVGKVHVVKETEQFAVLSSLAILRPSLELDSNYLGHVLKSPRTLNQASKSKTGSALRRVILSDLKNIRIPMPKLEEQKRIAAILDKADAIRRKRQDAIKLADEFLRAMFLDTFGDPITNPKGWDIFKMSEVIDFRGGNQPPKETFEYVPLEGYVRLIQIRDFKSDKYKTYIPKTLAKRYFEEDDVMIARYGPPVFQILRGLSGSYNVALMKAEPKKNITKDFIYWLLQLPAYHDTVVANSDRTAGQTGVNLDLLNNFYVPLPPKEIQNQICRKIQKAESAVKKMKSELMSLDQLFNSLSQRAFSGEL